MKIYSKIFGRLGNNLFQGAFIYSKMLDGEIPDIYVQDPVYFDHHRDEIRKLYGQDITPIKCVGIHVRRGDYINNSFYIDLMETDYYEKAMREFPSALFLVFSDDIGWCKEQKIFDGCAFAQNGDEISDFNLMAGCAGLIIANSSYSWWAAYLSNCGKVVAPSVENWYTDGVERTKCLPEWIRI